MNTEKMPLENKNEPSCLGAVSGSAFEKIIKLYENSLNWDFDGTAWLSATNYEESQKEFKEQLIKILNTL
jgi:hypothetical protein